MNARERVSDEVSRRNLVVRSNRHYDLTVDRADVVFMVGRLADFDPIRPPQESSEISDPGAPGATDSVKIDT